MPSHGHNYHSWPTNVNQHRLSTKVKFKALIHPSIHPFNKSPNALHIVPLVECWPLPQQEGDNIYNVVIWFGESFISLGECVINYKCYLIQRILSPGKVKVRSVLKLWSIFTLLSDLENAVIWSSQIDHSFGTRFFHYGFSFNSSSVVSVSYLVYVCYGPWLYRPWGRSADGREADGRGGWDRDPRS